MDLSILELALGVVCVCIISPPRWVYHWISREYRKQARALKANTPLSPAAESTRRAHEEANRSHGFMQLPGELRNRIYLLCMVSETVIDPIWGAWYGIKHIGPKECYLHPTSLYTEYFCQIYPEIRHRAYEDTWGRMGNMSQVCRVWRVEAVKHFYGCNVFKLPIGEHLHNRREPQWHAPWLMEMLSNWLPSVSEPAGKFALRRYYTSWLRKRPKEALAVMRLVLHDYRRCPHFIRQHALQSLRGSYMILLDFERRAVCAVSGVGHKDSFDLWHCDICWKRFVDHVSRLNQTEEIVALFAEFSGNMCADTAIKVVDGLRRTLEAQYIDVRVSEGLVE